MLYIVTVKLPRNPDRDLSKKVTGQCPIFKLEKHECTDVTGEHHSFLYYSNLDLDEVQGLWNKKYHVTRIEEVAR